MEYIRVVLTPPKIRPINRIIRSSNKLVKQEAEYITQNIRDEYRRPYLSAREPVKEALTAADINPVMKRAATTLSTRPFSSLYNVYMYGPCIG